MYRVTLYENAYAKNGIVLHEPANFGNKINSSNLETTLEGLGISTFEFSVNINNPAYRKIEPITNIIRITDNDNKQIFKGRVAHITNAMDSEGIFAEKILCEDQKAYLYDSTQFYMRPTLMSISAFLGKMLDVHNSQVDIYKRIYLGNVTVTDDDNVYRGLSYTKTAAAIKDKLLDRLGGYLILREDNGKLYLDYLKDYGETSATPLQIARNLKSARRELDTSELITRIVPLGQDIETSEEIDIGTDFSRPKVTIEAVNGGKAYLEDKELVKKFGVIQGTVEYPNVTDKNILKNKGQSYLDNQRLALITWTVEAIELGLLDKRYEIIKPGNSYPVANPPLYEGRETLQVIEKKVDILNPQKITLTIGTGKKTLSQYQLEYQGLQQTVDNVTYVVSSSTKSLVNVSSSVEMMSKKITDHEMTIVQQSTLINDQQVTLDNQKKKIQWQEEKILEQGETIASQENEIKKIKDEIDKLKQK